MYGLMLEIDDQLNDFVHTCSILARAILNAVNAHLVQDWTKFTGLRHGVEEPKCVISNSEDACPCGQPSESVLWEVDCVHEEATLHQFCEWLRSDATSAWSGTSPNPLLKYSRGEHWCYVDYKQMAFLFEDHPEILEAVRWSDLGFEHRDGRQSTIWIGSEGAFTPGHYDTYGFNLVAQIYGRKRWHLFPPSQTSLLYPTRIPYEESSIFSPINIANPAVDRYPKFVESTPYVLTLEPGEVLFVPKHWWHFVESLEVSISINSWVDVESDRESRVQEAVTRLLVSILMSNSCGPRKWVCPTEAICSEEVNYSYVRAALQESSCRSEQACTTEEARDSVEHAANSTRNIWPHKPDLDSALTAQNEGMKGAKIPPKTSEDGKPPTEVDEALKLNSPFSCRFGRIDSAEPSHSSNAGTGHRLKVEEKGPCSRDKMVANPNEGGERKRPHCETTGSETRPKLPRADSDEPIPKQSNELLPAFVFPVKCRGQIYKESQHAHSVHSDQEVLNIKQIGSEVKLELRDEEIRQMVAECVSHPAVISLAATLLQEKFDQIQFDRHYQAV
ncbi:HSPB1-associated protein 1-like [Acanthaster planci]|uniref:HSPB1-associated protein 1-like n=1 Tax=Acanthaster planci TaxID=133434 RepID=A0A8B7XWE9_ACAPL|nr:HSPB1-associated protein 1-like [Acanthaster planci]